MVSHSRHVNYSRTVCITLPRPHHPMTERTPVVGDGLPYWTARSGNSGLAVARRSVRRSAARSYTRSLIRMDFSDSKWSTNASTTAIAVSSSSLISCCRRPRSM